MPVIPLLRGWVRFLLVVLAILLFTVFGLALWLRPYNEDGTPLREETHRQLNLPACTFKVVTGKPCPSCGMTTSFALLVRGDVWNSLRANAVGTLLAVVCLAFIPWSLTCAFLGRPLIIQSLEGTLTRLVVLFLVLMLCRWGLVLLLDAVW